MTDLRTVSPHVNAGSPDLNAGGPHVKAGGPYVKAGSPHPQTRSVHVRTISSQAPQAVASANMPDLRIALLAADARTIARAEGRQTLGIRWVSHILQRIVVAMWSDHRTQQLLKRAGSAYLARRDALLRELRLCGIESHGESGLNVWIPVREETPVVQAMMAARWAVQTGERYRLTTGPAIRITIAGWNRTMRSGWRRTWSACFARRDTR